MEQNNTVLTTPKLVIRIALRVLFVALIIIFAFTGLKHVLTMFAPFLIGYVITALFISPLTKRIRKNSGRKVIAMLMVILITVLVLAIVGGVLYYLASQVVDLVKNWEDIKLGFGESLKEAVSFVAHLTDQPEAEFQEKAVLLLNSVLDNLEANLSEMFPGIAEEIGDAVPSIGRGLLAALFAVIATYFVAYDYSNIRSKIGGAIPKIIRPHMAQIQSAANSAMFGYLRAQLIISGIIALISFVVLLIFGQPFAILIAIAIGCVDFIPLLGSSVVTVPWTVLVVLQGDFRMGIILLILTFVLFMFRKITEPKIVGDQTGLHPVVSLICIYIGMIYGGLLGMILAPVLCMVMVTLYRVGFFKPAIDDIRALTYRVADWLKGTHEEQSEAADSETSDQVAQESELDSSDTEDKK